MKSSRLAILAIAGLGIAACSEVQPGTQGPLPGVQAGPGAPAINQISRQQPGSASVSMGVPAITGTSGSSSGEGGGRPTVTYTGQGSGTVSPGVPNITGATSGGGGQGVGGRPTITYQPPR